MDKFDLIKEECLKTTSDNVIEIIITIMQKDYINIHGPEHHVLDGSCFLVAMHNAGYEFDLAAALDEMIERGKKMPGAICGMWGVCGSSASIGAALAIMNQTSPLSNNQFYQDNLEYTSRALKKIGEVGGPRCCKRNAFLSLLIAIDFVNERYHLNLPKNNVSCIFSNRNKQCIKERCPFYKSME
ncbi:DUF5714 domain-containing protein [Thomasclavelia sp.]|uniref:DUF5714 domain-containing protein n=1 Tax=Thomasclavelia sp. TaxID=3025757 RepID=UPI0025D0E8FD|nr:DUF5714 domain-containing protein [Thomasclavelia sp.]